MKTEKHGNMIPWSENRNNTLFCFAVVCRLWWYWYSNGAGNGRVGHGG